MNFKKGVLFINFINNTPFVFFKIEERKRVMVVKYIKMYFKTIIRIIKTNVDDRTYKDKMIGQLCGIPIFVILSFIVIIVPNTSIYFKIFVLIVLNSVYLVELYYFYKKSKKENRKV
jgi:hypothetical protein